MDGSPTYHPNYYLVEWRTHNGVENIVWSDGYAEKARIQLKDAAFGLTETSSVDIPPLMDYKLKCKK
ncbi:hypothetical protein EEL30_10310 [Brevibacillus laterosporus]|uniref:Uncharacterized protein n=1 Tax=Brevibacillus laterosporus TaxID=1465 RepID=A0A518V6K4_BRELA|nr:hypothetical protein EEL30_10310 [Brevibacillus laterosporus]